LQLLLLLKEFDSLGFFSVILRYLHETIVLVLFDLIVRKRGKEIQGESERQMEIESRM
jgi:hypothetical protein